MSENTRDVFMALLDEYLPGPGASKTKLEWYLRWQEAESVTRTEIVNATLDAYR